MLASAENSEKSNHSKRQDMAAALLEDVLKYLKLNKEITKDNFAFRIVTVGSFGIFMLCSILNGLTTYFGEAIVCHGAGDKQKIMEQYCYMHGSYDLKQSSGKWNENCFKSSEEVRLRLRYLCDMRKKIIFTKLSYITFQNEVRTMYYQWVVFALVMSAILFRLPAWIWSMLEGGLMAGFYNSNKSLDALREGEDTLRHLAKKEANVFKKFQGKWTTKTYYLKFFVCQCLALLVLYLNFYGTDQFLDNKFELYGYNVVMKSYSYSKEQKKQWIDPMCNTFPTRVACQFNYTGSGGRLESINSYCLLSQNIINEKIYLALWFWFVAMFAIMIFQLIWEVCYLTLPLVDLILELILPSSSGICSKYLRQFLIGQLTGTRFLTRNMTAYLQNRSFGDVFILYQLGKNTHPNFFYEMLNELAVTEQETQPTQDVNEEEIEEGRMLLRENGMELNPVVTSN